MKYEYFQSYHDYFWDWETTSETVAVIRGESTIAYKEFLFAIIGNLAPQGLPPFGSLLLAIVATNPKGDSSLAFIHNLIARKLNKPDDVALEKAMKFLKVLAGVPPQYKTQSRRIVLLQTIFQRCHNHLSVDDSLKVASLCKDDNVDFDKIVPSDFMMGTFRFDFRPLALLVSQFETADDIIKKIGSLPDVEQIEIEFEERIPVKSDKPLDLVDELIENDKTFATGSLIRWLWGGLNIPVHSALPSHQPLGGISDLTNKGDFDKLLISEFAYDDITFLSRLANNEALYIHREIPPTHNDLHRVILVDASLKNWGTPKTIAFAVLLAIARHPKTDIDCQGFVLGNGQYYPVSTESIHTVIDALQIVAGNLHAAASLESFLRDHGKDNNTEIFFITESSALKHGPLLKVMHEHHDAINYLVLTDSEGNIDLYKKHQRARKHLQHIKLPLDKLWKKATRSQAPVMVRTATTAGDVPILFKLKNIKKLVTSPDGEFFALTERCIMKYFDKKSKSKGWALLQANLPFTTSIFEMGLSTTREYFAILYNSPKRELLLINFTTSEKTSVTFDHWRQTEWPSFIFDSNAFYHHNKSGTWRIALDGKVDMANLDDAKQKFLSRAEELKGASISLNGVILKNINQVFINGVGQLIFNIHVLQPDREYLRLIPASDRSMNIRATKVSDTEFRFDDGSTVEVNRCGLAILRSSDERLSPIYIPTVLEGTLGVATEEIFAGNDYYFRDNNLKNQKKLSPSLFYQNFIQFYIKVIRSHGA
jgi:hypothetical protein